MRFRHWFWFSDGRWRKHFQVIDHQVAVAAFGRVWILEVDVIVQIGGRKLLLAGWHAEARFVNCRAGLDGGDIEAFDFFAVDGESHSGGLRSGLLAVSPRSQDVLPFARKIARHVNVAFPIEDPHVLACGSAGRGPVQSDRLKVLERRLGGEIGDDRFVHHLPRCGHVFLQ